MPTYEYECKSCGSVFDLFQSITASPLRKAKCETCGGSRSVRRLIGTGSAVLFKGSGFYHTDYRSEGYKKSAESENKPAGDDAAKKEASPAKEAPASKDSSEKKHDAPSKKKKK